MGKDLTPDEAAQVALVIADTAIGGARGELLPATLTIDGNIRARPFNKGQRADGDAIGDYSTVPFYVHIPTALTKYGGALPGLQARGKAPKGKKKGAKARKLHGEVVPIQSKYYPGGYAEFREDVNRQSDHVDLMLTGRMGESLKTGLQGEDECVIQFDKDEEAKKARGLEKRFTGEEDTIFVANGQDVETFIEQLSDAAFAAVGKLFAE